EADASALDIEMYAAGQLFLQYARRVQPTFALDAEERACVARICELVVGMPLALELAASWLRLLSCREIAEELAHSSDFLSSALRDAPERHRSLRAVFEYSWQLLSEAEKRAVQALSVFQGSFQREAAIAVLRDPDAPARPVMLLRLLAALVDKSLLQHYADGEYVMHALLREYAREKLRAAPALESHIRHRHSAYYLALLQQRRADLEGAEQRAALTLLSHVLEDVRSAWQWAAQHQRVTLVEQGMHSLAHFFSLSGRRQEGLLLFETAIAALEPLATPEAEAARGWLLAFAANLATYTEEDDRSQSLASAALKLAQRLDIAPVKARALAALGRLAWLGGEYEVAGDHYRQALEIYRAEDDLRGQAKTLDSLGANAWAVGHYDEAQTYFERSQALFRQIGDLSGSANALDHLGVVARDTGDLETAKTCFEQSYRCFRDLDARVSLAYAANHLGGVLAMMGSLEDAQPYFEQCIAIGQELGERRIVAYTRYDWGAMLAQRGHPDGGLPMLIESETLFETSGDQFGLILARATLGDIALQNDDPPTARGYYWAAMRSAMALQNLRLMAHALIGWARYLEAVGQPDAAAETLGHAQALPHDVQETGEGEATLLARLEAQLSAEDLAAALARGKAADLADICPVESSNE
ncbi:MAG: ATP-binding protein, partial [Anaerolineales bacterium]